MFSTRPLVPSDQDWLWDILHIALWDPPPAPLRPREVLDHPAVRIYAENWGGPGDVGVVGQLSGVERPIGAAWMRLIANQQGLAYVDDETPQIGIALFPEFQQRGYGKPLMLSALEAARIHGYKQVALTVHPENPAIKVYERCGYAKVALRGTYHLMVVKL